MNRVSAQRATLCHWGWPHSLPPTWFSFFHNQPCDLGKELNTWTGRTINQPSPPPPPPPSGSRRMTEEKNGSKVPNRVHTVGIISPGPQQWPWRLGHSEPQLEQGRPASFVQQGAVQPGEGLRLGGGACELSPSPVPGVF